MAGPLITDDPSRRGRTEAFFAPGFLRIRITNENAFRPSPHRRRYMHGMQRHCQIGGLEFKSYAPPAEPQWIGVSPAEIESIAYAVLPPGYVGSPPARSGSSRFRVNGRWKRPMARSWFMDRERCSSTPTAMPERVLTMIG